MKKVIGLFLLLYCTGNLYSQKKVNYNTVYNEPENSNNLTVSALLIGSEQDGSALIDFPVGVQLNYTMNRLGFEFRYDVSLPSRISSSNDPSHNLKHDYAEINATLFFSKKEKQQSMKVVIGEQVNYYSKTTTTTFIRVPVKAVKLWGLRGGLWNQQASASIKHNPDLKSYHAVGVNGFFAGITSRKFHHFRVEVEQYNKKRITKRFSDFYIDAMFAPVISINSGYNGTDYDVSEIGKKNIGGRIGWQWVSTRNTGFFGRIETGLRPGVLSARDSHFFLLMGLGIAFSGKVGSI